MPASYLPNSEISSTISDRIESTAEFFSISDDETFKAKKNSTLTSTPIVLEFDFIPDRICSASITFDKKEFLAVITPKSCVFYKTIDLFFMLLNQGTVWVLEKSFVTINQLTIRNNYIATHAELFEFFFRGGVIANNMNRLKTCQSVLIPVLNNRLKKTKAGTMNIPEGIGILLFAANALLHCVFMIHLINQRDLKAWPITSWNYLILFTLSVLSL